MIKGLLLAVWMSFCTILAGQENIILVTDTIDGVSVTYPVEIDMESKREHEKMEEKFNKMVALNEKIESGIPVSQEEMEAVYGKQEEPVKVVKKKDTVKTAYTERDILFNDETDLHDEAQPYLDVVPDKVLDTVISNGYKMYFVDNPGAEINTKGICGLTNIKTKTILVQNEISKFRKAIVHEIGHAYDGEVQKFSLTFEFKDIYNEEVDKFVVTGYQSYGHYKTNLQEYFAEAFQEYCFNAEELQKTTPQTYDYIRKTIEG